MISIFAAFRHYYKNFILVIFFASSFVAESQQVDLYEKITQNNIQQALFYANSIRTSEPKKHQVLLQRLTVSKEIMNEEQKQYLSLLLAYQNAYDGNYQAAVDATQQLVAENPVEFIAIRAHGLLVNLSLLNKDLLLGFKHLEQMKQISQSSNIKSTQEFYYALASMFYGVMGEKQLALDYAVQGLTLTETKRDKCMAMGEVIKLSLALDEMSVKDPDINDGILLCDSINETIVAGFIRLKLAQSLINDDQANQAIDLLLPHQKRINDTDYPSVIGMYYFVLADANWHINQVEKSKQHALTAYKASSHMTTSEPFVNTLNLLYKIEKNLGNTAEALQYLERYVTADKAYLTEESKKSKAVELIKQQTLKKEIKIKELSQENLILATQQQLAIAGSQRTRLLVLLLSLSIILLIIIAFFLLRKKGKLSAKM